jgi:8-oxo-dGTP pyrophosphatase MutT (NUDIX family)
MSPLNVVQKVIAYITHGDDILVFEEPDFPEVGTQVPGGTLEPDEAPVQGVLREAHEETGLPALEVVRFLGSKQHIAASGKHQLRHFFHLSAISRERETWEHWEQAPSTGGPPIRVHFRWVSRHEIPPLTANQGDMLAQLASGMDRFPEAKLSTGTRVRHASRVLLLDPDNRLLLLRVQLEDRTLWVAPGGGLEDGEDFVAAALREVREETGASVDLGPIVWLRRHVFDMPGCTLDQSERYFVARASTTKVAPTRQDEYVSGYRWWSLHELAACNDTFAPRSLTQLLPRILDGSYPNPPIDVGV